MASKKLSFRASGFAVLALIVSLAAVKFGFLIPKEWTRFIGNNALDQILEIFASSMLLVVTFSLATMVSAYSTASAGVTPRATRLLLEDHKSQNVISIFLGAFIFSIVTMVALSTQYYSDGARFILFIFTALLIILVIATIIGWVDSLSRLGRVHETIQRLEAATQKALKRRAKSLSFDCVVYDKAPGEALDIFHEDIGYIQSVGFNNLQKYAIDKNHSIYIEAEPGTYITAAKPIAKVINHSDSELDHECKKSIQNCFIVDDARSFDDDPRFGFICLGEVASRALSPAVNDPGTAIDVISSMIRLFNIWDQCVKCEQEVKYDKVFARPMDSEQFFKNIVLPLSRDGAGHIEVVARLHKGLKAIGKMQDQDLVDAAAKYQDILIRRAQQTLAFDDEKAMLIELVST